MRSLLRFFDTQGASSTNLAGVVDKEQTPLDVDALASYMSFDVPVPASRTIYSGIRAEILPDAWGQQVASRVEPVRNVREAVARLRRTLERAIERVVGNHRRVAVLAGGGIDSAVLLALTLEVVEKRGATAFALAMDFEGPGDDRPHMRALQARLDCEVVRVGPTAGAEHVAIIRAGVDAAPVLWPLSPYHFALFDAARKNGADCLLTGAGGDHFFDGDPCAFARLLTHRPFHAISAARSLRDFDEPRFPVFERIFRPLVARRLPSSVRRLLARRHREPPDSASWAGPRLLESARISWERKLEWALSRAETKSLASYFEHPQRRHIAWLVHQEQRAAGIARHDPYFSYEVGEEVAALSPETLLIGGRRRGLLREVMRGKLPDSLLDRSDKAEFAPAFRTFFEAAGGVRAFAEELEGRRLGRLGLVNPQTFKREASRALEAGEEGMGYGLAWAAVATEAFLSQRPELA